MKKLVIVLIVLASVSCTNSRLAALEAENTELKQQVEQLESKLKKEIKKAEAARLLAEKQRAIALENVRKARISVDSAKVKQKKLQKLQADQ